MLVINKPRWFFSKPSLIREAIHALMVLALFSSSVGADDAAIGKRLKANGAEVTESKGIITGVTIQDGSNLTDEDFHQITRLTHLKMLSLSKGLNDGRLAQLTVLAELEYL